MAIVSAATLSYWIGRGRGVPSSRWMARMIDVRAPSLKIRRFRDRLKDRTVRRRRWSMLRIPQGEWAEATRRRHLDAFVTNPF